MSTGTCGCSEDRRFAAIRGINEGVDSIRDGLFDIRVGQNSIESGFVTCGAKRCCEGVAACRAGVRDIQAGMQAVRSDLSPAERQQVCEGLRDIQSGLCGTAKGVQCARQGNVSVGNCAINAGQDAICEGFSDVLSALSNIT